MTTEKLKTEVMRYLVASLDNTELPVFDARQRAPLTLPCVAVDITSAAAHSFALQGVLKCDIEITFRSHSGDEGTADIQANQDILESAIYDPSSVKAFCDQGIRIDMWNFGGSQEDWDDSTMETAYAVEVLCAATA